MARKLVAALACRNRGSRLYGKPLQNLSVSDGITILDNIIDCLKRIEAIDEIVLGIAEGNDNAPFRDLAESRGLKWIEGDEEDVLGRLIQCAEAADATDIFRVTSESPFPYFAAVEQAWARYLETDADALLLDEIIDGCGFEILSYEVLKTSHTKGEDRHRSELCTLYLRENHEDFRILRETAPEHLNRKDLRLTVDNPEDLVLARAVYQEFAEAAPNIPIDEVVTFLDANTHLIELCYPFTEIGYQTMYVWGAKE